MKESEKISKEILKEILDDFDNNVPIQKMLDKGKTKWKIGKGKLFKIFKENGKHRLDTGIASYRKELEMKAKVYWKLQGIEPPKNSLIEILEPAFGEEMARKLIDAFAFMKNKPKLKKILESEIL